MSNEDDRAEPPRPGEADTPREAHDAAAPDVRRLREGDDAPQDDTPAEDRRRPA